MEKETLETITTAARSVREDRRRVESETFLGC